MPYSKVFIVYMHVQCSVPDLGELASPILSNSISALITMFALVISGFSLCCDPKTAGLHLSGDKIWFLITHTIISKGGVGTVHKNTKLN